MQYNGIRIDQDFELDFCKYYQNNLLQLNNLLDHKKISQKQFMELQHEFFKNCYQEFYIQRVECGTDLIDLV
tara:strand:- start:112 stop:327 length:216 start_codon:yes stop_codon:yes gene_type:complete